MRRSRTRWASRSISIRRCWSGCRKSSPLVRLNESNVADYWTALEGVSHFHYFAWNAGHDKPVTLLELELQAEIDKYVASYLLLQAAVSRALSSRAAARSVRAHAHRFTPGAGAGRTSIGRPRATRRSSAGAWRASLKESPSGDGRAECWRSCAVSIGSRTRARSLTSSALPQPSEDYSEFRLAVLLALFHGSHQLEPLGELLQIALAALRSCGRARPAAERVGAAIVGIERVVVAHFQRDPVAQLGVAAAAARVSSTSSFCRS